LKPAAESGIAQRVWWFWAAYIVAIGYNLATSHWVQAVAGLNRMRDQQFAYALGSLTYICCAALLLICHLGLLSMVVATFARGFMMHGRCHQIYRQVVPKPEHPARPDARIVRKLWPNASKFGVLAIGGYCLSSGGVLICSQLLGPEVTASFGLTTQIGNFMMNLAVIWLAVKWPEVAILRAQGRLEEMAVLFARRLGLAVVSFVGMALITLAAGNVLLAWKGTHTRLLATPYLAFYLVYVMQQVIYQQFSILVYTENVVPFFKISIYTGLAAITLSLAMTPPFGLWGLLIAPFVAEMACNCWYTVRRGFQGQPLTPRKFALAALGGWD
jgi:O-antigen/teichoic acid export membrane protein